jgi:hypothetical protein
VCAQVELLLPGLCVRRQVVAFPLAELSSLRSDRCVCVCVFMWKEGKWEREGEGSNPVHSLCFSSPLLVLKLLECWLHDFALYSFFFFFSLILAGVMESGAFMGLAVFRAHRHTYQSDCL